MNSLVATVAYTLGWKRKTRYAMKVVTVFILVLEVGGVNPVLTCRPTASTSLAAVRVFETLRASGRRSGF